MLAALWWNWIAFGVAVFWFGFNLYFFRNPKVLVPVDAGAFVSPAAGKIVFVGRADEKDFLKRNMQRVTVFMSPFDVHVNRAPESGTVVATAYHHGRFMAAFREDASLFNERSCVHLRTDSGREIIFVQIAGWFARRIISYAQAGERYVRGDVFGLIKFGSRMDIYFPDDVNVMVKVGDKVRAGADILARVL
jgi:phosphatidylserine decarboxylase